MQYLPSDARYQSMKYNRVGRSCLRLPAVSLGFWHNFGDVDVFENGMFLLRRNETLPPPPPPPPVSNPPPPAPGGGGGGGGGGALDFAVLILLAGFAILRARRVSPVRSRRIGARHH